MRSSLASPDNGRSRLAPTHIGRRSPELAKPTEEWLNPTRILSSPIQTQRSPTSDGSSAPKHGQHSVPNRPKRGLKLASRSSHESFWLKHGLCSTRASRGLIQHKPSGWPRLHVALRSCHAADATCLCDLPLLAILGHFSLWHLECYVDDYVRDRVVPAAFANSSAA